MNEPAPTRKKSHVAIVALLPVFVQIGLFFFIASWAEGAGSGKGMLGLFSFIIILGAIPVTMIINIIVATFTPQLHIMWMLVLAIFIAIVLPVLAGLAILTGL